MILNSDKTMKRKHPAGRLVYLCLAALMVLAPSKARAEDFTIETRAGTNSVTNTSTHFRYQDEKGLDLGAEWFTHSKDRDLTSGALRIPLNDYLDFFGFADTAKTTRKEGGLIIEPGG